MKRRSFIKKGAAAASFVSVGLHGMNALNNHEKKEFMSKHNFNLKYAKCLAHIYFSVSFGT